MPFISLPHPDEARFGDVFRTDIHMNARKIILDERLEKYKLGSDIIDKQTNPLLPDRKKSKQFIVKGPDDIYRRVLLRHLTGKNWIIISLISHNLASSQSFS